MKILKISFVLILLLWGMTDANAQLAELHDGNGCARSNCGFTMCMESYNGPESTGDQECLLVEMFLSSPQDIYMVSDSDDYVEFNDVTYASTVICYDLSQDQDLHDGEIYIGCGIYENTMFGGSNNALCKDGCIVTVGDD